MIPRPGSPSPTMAGPPPAPCSSTGRGQVTDFVAQRYRTPGASSPETWSTPITGYGEFEGLRLPARGKAIYKLPGGDLEYIDVALTGLHYDTGAAPLEGKA